MKILVIAEHDHAGVKAATRHAVAAAAKIGAAIGAQVPIDVLVAGSDCAGAAQAAAAIAGVAKVLVADAPAYADQAPENVAARIVELVTAGQGDERYDYGYVLAAATSAGKNLLPRVAALLDVAQISEVIAIVAPDRFVRPIYAGSVLATVESGDAVKVMTVRTTAFDAAAAGTGAAATIEPISAGPHQGKSRVVSRALTQSARPALAAAKVVVAGGRGLGSGENFHALLEPLADKLGAALGASRAAVDAGFVANELQVGQTGMIVAPQLYIAVGISGAIQHLAGMKDSQVIVAINKDPEAAIFQSADYALVGDLFELVPQLTAALG